MAPEALHRPAEPGRAARRLLLGAIAYHLFRARRRPRPSLELAEKLREGKGLQIASVLNGAGEHLRFLIQYSTHPEVTSRLDSVDRLPEPPREVEDELTARRRTGCRAIPTAATAGRPPQGGYVVKQAARQGLHGRRLPRREGRARAVLKLALDPEQNERAPRRGRGAAPSCATSTSSSCTDTVEIGEHAGPAHGSKAGDETLAQRLRAEGRLHVDLLQRFGEDLLQAVQWLEHQGIPHRDIKPDNIAIAPIGRSDRLHLVLFDFSLSRDAGRAHPRRHGAVPRPVPVAPEAAALGPARRALRRRHDALRDGDRHAAALGRRPERPGRAGLRGHARRRAVRREPARAAGGLLPEGAPARLPRSASTTPRRCCAPGGSAFAARRPLDDHDRPRRASPTSTRRSPPPRSDTPLAALGLSTRAINALERVNAVDVRGLLRLPVARISHMRGVGNKTRRELLDVLPQAGGPLPRSARGRHRADARGRRGRRASRVERRPAGPAARADARRSQRFERARVLRTLAGPRRRGCRAEPGVWPSQTEAAVAHDLTRARSARSWRRPASAGAGTPPSRRCATRSSRCSGPRAGS